MTVKEKAKELLDKYYNTECIEETDDAYMCEHLAKKCAILCVDEIINSKPIEPNHEHSESLSGKVESSIQYWEQVKEEINGL